MSGYFKQRKFGELVRIHRTGRGMSQQQLAGLSTVSVRAIRNLELNQAQRPHRDTVRLIANGLGLDGRRRNDFEAAAGWEAPGEVKSLQNGAVTAPPRALDQIIGRDAEVAVLREQLASGAQRLATIVGLHGVGKTRTAIEVATMVHDELGFAVLWNAWDGGAAASGAVAQTAVLADDGVPRRPDEHSSTDELGSLIGDRPTLLVMDGYDSDRISTERLMALLTECRQLRVLTTALAPFEIPGESTFPLAPLAVPDREHTDTASLMQVPSVRLLLHYIRQVRPEFTLAASNAEAVAGICDRLDGIPLALEAAASWSGVYEPDTMLEQVCTAPFDLVADRLPNLDGQLASIVEHLGRSDSATLDSLLETDDGMSMDEAIHRTGMTPVECARSIRRLLTLGLLRRSKHGTGITFRALSLVRALRRDRWTSRYPELKAV